MRVLKRPKEEGENAKIAPKGGMGLIRTNPGGEGEKKVGDYGEKPPFTAADGGGIQGAGRLGTKGRRRAAGLGGGPTARPAVFTRGRPRGMGKKREGKTKSPRGKRGKDF